MCNRGGIYSTVAPPTLLPITSTPGGGGGGGGNTTASMEYIGVYSVITISIHVDIVYKRVINIVKDIQAIDHQLNKFKDSLNKIKDKLIFLKRSIIVLVCNIRLPDIK